MIGSLTGEGAAAAAVQKKGIVIYTYKQQHLSIDMKTKVVRDVQRINISMSHITCDM